MLLIKNISQITKINTHFTIPFISINSLSKVQLDFWAIEGYEACYKGFLDEYSTTKLSFSFEILGLWDSSFATPMDLRISWSSRF